MKTLKEIKSGIVEVLIDMAIYTPTPSTMFRYASNIGGIIKDLVGHLEKLEADNLRYKKFLNWLYGYTLKDLDYLYVDTDSIKCETGLPKLTIKEVAELFLDHAHNTYRLCPSDSFAKDNHCDNLICEDRNICVECWCKWLTSKKCEGEN